MPSGFPSEPPIKFNIPEAEAAERLVDLMREHEKKVEQESAETAAS